jgi:hypothetical protein
VANTSYTQIFERFPPELREPLAQLVEAIEEQLGIKRVDFEELKGIVRDLVQAQQRTEARMEELVQAQQRTEARMEELVQAQKRTEERLDHQDEALASFRRDFDAKIGGLGARWGLQSEGAFREGMQAILEEVGFITERVIEYDTEGEVFGYPEYIELDVVAHNGKLILVEIKSSFVKADAYVFQRKVDFYAQKTDRQVDRKLVITPYADPRAVEVAARLGLEICTDADRLKKT